MAGFSLKRIFAAAALGLAMMATPAAPEAGQSPAGSKQVSGRDVVAGDPAARPPLGIVPDVAAPELTPALLDELWDDIVAGPSAPFKPFMPQAPLLPPGHGPVVLQLESTYPEVQGLILNPYYSPLTALERHGAAATGILDSTADKYSRHDVPVMFLDRPGSLQSWIFDPNNPETRALLARADILSLSMAFVTHGDQADHAIGTLTTQTDIDQACALWQNSHTLFVWGAGNNGRDLDIDLERPPAFHTMCADTLVRVGEAETDLNRNQTYIEPWSSRPASFVMRQPFQEGFKYQYYRDGNAARDYMESLYAAPSGDGVRTNAQVFDEKFSGRSCGVAPNSPACDTQLAYEQNRLQACHPSFNKAKFPGKDILTGDKHYMRDHPEAVRQAFESCLVNAAEARKKDAGADRHGFVDNRRGTSFSTPYFAGIAAAAHELYPQLSTYDLTAAALMAAHPVDSVRRAIDNQFIAVPYHDNGRGLPHNSYAGGFGLLEPDDYMQMAQRMAELVAADPSLATREQWIRSVNATFTAPDEKGRSHNDYHINVTDDVVVLQTILKLKFDGVVPAKITLINPAGAEEDIAPTLTETGEMVYSLANTLGNFGNHSRGQWTVRVSSDVKISEAQLIIPGFAPGGVIERMLEQVTGHRAPVMPPPAP